MAYKDPEDRRAYMRAYYHQMKVTDPEKAAVRAEKDRQAALAKRNKNVEKARADFKKWYDNGGKEKQRKSHGSATYEEYRAAGAEKRKTRAEYMQEWNKTEKGQRNRVAAAIKKRCNGSIDEYDAQYEKQNGRCQICGSQHSKYGLDRMAIDHDHATGKFRGLLCGNCNTGIGLMGDNVENLQQAIAYLTQGS